jgi:hypothetical protein
VTVHSCVQPNIKLGLNKADETTSSTVCSGKVFQENNSKHKEGLRIEETSFHPRTVTDCATNLRFALGTARNINYFFNRVLAPDWLAPRFSAPPTTSFTPTN